MYHQELSQTMSQKGSLGLGDWLAEQVTKQASPKQAVEAYQTHSQLMAPQQALPLELPMAVRASVSLEEPSE